MRSSCRPGRLAETTSEKRMFGSLKSGSDSSNLAMNSSAFKNSEFLASFRIVIVMAVCSSCVPCGVRHALLMFLECAFSGGLYHLVTKAAFSSSPTTMLDAVKSVRGHANRPSRNGQVQAGASGRTPLPGGATLSLHITDQSCRIAHPAPSRWANQ